ncbi:hypothetical protein MOQ72_00800 [Saccharopolyspora sp. K220]|uniref:hypothetical protein n=1 Tax=Saccharopolyspora soli TaxID=2926618 RepID=UPI001F579CC7|nr:hypothetical protein [Saccharopolyspora soli]MCI2415949.1 hypothetical protein [Saccharopolyspora soli]
MTTALDNLHVVMLESLQDPEVDVKNYKNNFHTLTSTAGQVYSYKIAQLNDPSQWPGGAGAYYAAQQSWNNVAYDLQNWANTTLKKANLNISDFVYDDVTISPRLTEAIKCAEQLIQNPGDDQTKVDFQKVSRCSEPWEHRPSHVVFNLFVTSTWGVRLFRVRHACQFR